MCSGEYSTIIVCIFHVDMVVRVVYAFSCHLAVAVREGEAIGRISVGGFVKVCMLRQFPGRLVVIIFVSS